MAGDTGGHAPINLRNVTVVCGNCEKYQTLCGFEPRGEWHVYTFECENGRCEVGVTRTLIQVPAELDEFAQRDPNWRGGEKFGGG